jgi:hypothetical protein
MWLRHRFVKLWRFNGFVLSQSPICDVDMVTTGVLWVNGIFFSLFKQIREMNLDKTYFPYLVLWSRANPIGATYEEVGGRDSGAVACRDADMEPCRPQSCQVV